MWRPDAKILLRFYFFGFLVLFAFFPPFRKRGTGFGLGFFCPLSGDSFEYSVEYTTFWVLQLEQPSSGFEQLKGRRPKLSLS